MLIYSRELIFVFSKKLSIAVYNYLKDLALKPKAAQCNADEVIATSPPKESLDKGIHSDNDES